MNRVRQVYFCLSGMHGGSNVFVWIDGVFPFWCLMRGINVDRRGPRAMMRDLLTWIDATYVHRAAGPPVLADSCEFYWAKAPDSAFERPTVIKRLP